MLGAAGGVSPGVLHRRVRGVLPHWPHARCLLSLGFWEHRSPTGEPKGPSGARSGGQQKRLSDSESKARLRFNVPLITGCGRKHLARGSRSELQ